MGSRKGDWSEGGEGGWVNALLNYTGVMGPLTSCESGMVLDQIGLFLLTAIYFVVVSTGGGSAKTLTTTQMLD